MENREDDRIMARLTLRIQSEDGTCTIGSTRNLSRQGAFINHKQGRVGERLRLYLQHPAFQGEERRIVAEVVHCDGDGIGVRFVPQLRSLAEFLVLNGFGPHTGSGARVAARRR